MPYTKYLTGYFQNDPQKYASEIIRKEQLGGQFTDQPAAEAFKKAYPDLFKTQKAAQQPTPVQSQAPTPQPAQPQIQQPQNITQEFTPQVQDLLSQIKSYISRPPQTPDQMLQSDYGQQLTGAVDTLRDQQMRQARAQLAAAGGLYPDDTRAAERFAQVGAEAARMQAAEVLPALMQAAQSQRSMGLNELLSGLGAQSGEEAAALNRVLSQFQTYMPWRDMTPAQKAELYLRGSELGGQFSPFYPGQEISYAGGADISAGVPQSAQQYVSGNMITDVRPFVQAISPGARVDWDASRPNEVRINGLPIQGRVVNGKIQVPVGDVRLALGV
jgi:hypothetical protein